MEEYLILLGIVCVLCITAIAITYLITNKK